MTVTIELRRKGKSKSSNSMLPVEARMITDGHTGENILGKQQLADVNGAKSLVLQWLRDVYGKPVDVEWVGSAELDALTATHDVEMGQWKAGQSQGLLDRTLPLSAEKARRK